MSEKELMYWQLRARNAERMLVTLLQYPSDEDVRRGVQRLLEDVKKSGVA